MFGVVFSWCRGKVRSVEMQNVDVFFVDYGDCEILSSTDLLPLPPCFEQIPFEAIECCLVDIECIGNEWDNTFDNIVTIGEKILDAEAGIIDMLLCLH